MAAWSKTRAGRELSELGRFHYIGNIRRVLIRASAAAAARSLIALCIIAAEIPAGWELEVSAQKNTAAAHLRLSIAQPDNAPRVYDDTPASAAARNRDCARRGATRARGTPTAVLRRPHQIGRAHV